MSYLPDALYAQIESSVPIACVDFVPVRVAGTGAREIGLILRDSPHGRVWCHLGGRVQRGETIAQALRRHAAETLGVDLSLALNPQPRYVYEWFPRDVAPTDGTTFGDDPRKHSIGLSFVVEIVGEPQAANEAIEFRYFAEDALPQPLWPGCKDLLDRMGIRG